MDTPYYKLQVFNDVSLSWVDIQKAYDTVPTAIVARHRNAGKRVRVMEIVGKVRQPLLNV